MKINTENSDEAFYKEKYLKNREKLQKAVKLLLKKNEIILKLRTKIKIEELKNRVKTEKINFTESMIFDKVIRNSTIENNDITSEKFETFLHIMNVKHTETVSNMLNIFKSNKNINSISRLNKMDLLLICAL